MGLSGVRLRDNQGRMARSAVMVINAYIAAVVAHGALVSPPTRNAFDGFLPRYAHGKHSECNCGDVEAGCDSGNRQGMNG